jgi:polar amino acid transport system substrate-binding protein
MRLKTPFALLPIVLLAAFSVAGCGDDEKSDKGGSGGGGSKAKGSVATPSPLKAGGDFTVCTDVPYPPAESLDGNEFVGYEIDLMKEVAERLDTNAQFEKTAFDAIIPALDAKRCDAIISSMNVTPERQKQVGFVTYMEIGQSLMVPADSKEDIASLDDLAGMKVAVQSGTTLRDALEAKSKELEQDGKEAIEVQTFPDAAAAAQALKSGRVDVFFADSPVVADYVNKDSNSFAFAGEPIDPLPVGIATRKSDTELHDAIQQAVDAMYADGAMLDILGEWKVQDFALQDEDQGSEG